MYFRSIIDDQPYCDEHVVNLDDAFIDDLRSVDTTPAYSFITPNLCDDGHDANCTNGDVGGLSGTDRLLKQWVPYIPASTAFIRDDRKRDVEGKRVLIRLVLVVGRINT